MQLPDPIRQYFEAEERKDAAALAASFVADAVVQDEGQDHVGREEIRLWWQAAQAKYAHRAEPVEMESAADRVRVRAMVSGNFAGSPAKLTFDFILAADGIARLKIGG